MSVTLAVLLAAVIASLGVWVLSRAPGGVDPIDPEAEQRWLVRWLVDRPRLGSTARSIDRRAAGGLMLVVALSIVFVTALVVGLVFDMVDRRSGLARWDMAVAEWGSQQATGWSTTALDAITRLGGTSYLVVFFLPVASYDYVRHRNPNVPLFLLTVLAGVVLINNGLKMIVGRERPDVAQLVATSGSSFPSGHSAAAAAAWFALALVLARRWSRRRRAGAAAVATVIAIAVGASRALLGVHWLTDVVAGLMVGWGWFLLSALVFGGRLQRLGEPAERAGSTRRMSPLRRSRRTNGGALERRHATPSWWRLSLSGARAPRPRRRRPASVPVPRHRPSTAPQRVGVRRRAPTTTGRCCPTAS